MLKIDFQEEIKNSCSEILYLCIIHIFEKKYKDQESIDEKELKDFLSDYQNFHRYLNDYAGTIYNRYGSHINILYVELCNYLKIEVDNQYTLEHYIMKLEKQTPQLLLGLTNEDIQLQTIEHFDEKLVDIRNSKHFLENIDKFEPRVQKLEQNIALVKNALNIR